MYKLKSSHPLAILIPFIKISFSHHSHIVIHIILSEFMQNLGIIQNIRILCEYWSKNFRNFKRRDNGT